MRVLVTGWEGGRAMGIGGVGARVSIIWKMSSRGSLGGKERVEMSIFGEFQSD